MEIQTYTKVFWVIIKGFQGQCCRQILIPSLINLIYCKIRQISPNLEEEATTYRNINKLSQIMRKFQIKKLIDPDNIKLCQKRIRFRIIIQQYKLIKLQSSQVDIPLHVIQNNFKLRIISITKFYQFGCSTYYTTVTQLGSLNLVVQKANNICQQNNNFLRTRNCLIAKFSSYFPLILQQTIVVLSGQIFCFTLIQLCNFYEKQQQRQKQKLRIDHFSNLVRGCYILSEHNMCYSTGFKYPQLLYFVNSSQINLDFTCISTKQKNNQKEGEVLSKLKDLIIFMFKNNSKINDTKQINLIHDKLYMFVPELIKKASDLFQLLIMLNLDRDMIVQIELTPMRKKISKMNFDQSGQKDVQIRKTKKVRVHQLEGKQKFLVNNKYYDSLIFLQGRCINCLQQLSQEEQKDYIKPGFHYKLHKMQNLYIECVQSKYTLQDKIIVYPPVQKIQFISFIIFYIKSIQPTLLSISYIQSQNSLRIEYLDKKKHERHCKIVFYESYIVKDEEITMLLERCKLKKCKLDFRFMKINDTLLMFLANSEKTSKIIELHLSDCYGLTDNGINILLVSPFCKNLQAISLILDDGLMSSAVQLLNIRPELKVLNIQRNSFNKQHHHKTQISISKMKLAELSSKGIKISLNNLNTDMLKILKITQMITVEELKLLRNLKLTELKLRIMQSSKKSMMQSTSSFITNAIVGKTNPVKYFADGPSSNTLKSLDLSDSNIKFITMKYMFWMMELEKLYLDNCELGNQFEPISAKILVLSLVNTQISKQNLSVMLQKTPMLNQLNIIYNDIIWREQIYSLIVTSKIMIKNLMICQKCYSNRLIQSTLNVNQPFELITQISLYVQDLVNIHMEGILYSIMLKIIETTKIINLLTIIDSRIPPPEDEQIKLQFLISRIVYFLKMTGKKLSNFRNMRINNKNLEQMIKKQIQIPTQSVNYMEIIVKDRATFISIQSMDDQPIDQLTQRIVSVIKKYPESQLILCIKDNKIIPKQSIKMLAIFCKNNLTQINFCNCTFKLGDVIKWIFDFPNLVVFNEGIIDFTFPPSSFVEYSYRFMKFCMNLRFIRRFCIECSDVEDYQVLYSVIEHIIEKNISHLIKLSIKLNNIQLNLEFDTLMQKICAIEQLIELQLIINNNNLRSSNKITQLSEISKLTKIKALSLKMPVHIFPHINIKNIQDICLDFTDSSIQESQVNKIIKGMGNGTLRSMNLNFQNSAMISPHKIFSLGPNSNLFEKLLSIQNLILNFQFCNLKQFSLHETLRWISKLSKLKTFTLNVSFAITNLSELIKYIHQIAVNGQKQSQICVISVTANSKDFQYNKQFYKQLGVQFVF